MLDAVIFGAGGHGREVLDSCIAAEAAGATDLHVIGFIDDDASSHGSIVSDHPVFGGIDWLRANAGSDVRVLVGVGSPVVHRQIVLRVADMGFHFGSIMHPSVRVSPFAKIGYGAIISVNALVMTGAYLGRHVNVNTGVSIAHDVVIDDFANLAPRVALAGNVHVGTGADIGIGASIIQGITIGEWAVVGAGAVVINDVPANSIVTGVPATVKKWKEFGWHEI
jgi:sugar O-acyltransferase (sialic acid O-acetyltransferase NeuD family)